MPDTSSEDESVASFTYSDSSATYVYNIHRYRGVTFEDYDTSGDELADPDPFQISHTRKRSSLSSAHISKESDPPAPRPRVSRAISNFGQPLVHKPEAAQSPSKQESESIEHPPPTRISPSPSKPIPRTQYPSVPDMSRARPSSPDPVSSQYRGSRPQAYYDRSPYHRYVPGKEKDSRDYRNRSRSPQPAETRDAHFYRPEVRETDARPYPPSPSARHIRDTYYPDRLRMQAELEHYRAREDVLQSSYQQQKREIQIRKEVEQELKLQLAQRRSAQEEAKKELEKARLEAENTAREKLEAERKARKALREREEEQAKRIERAVRLRLETERKAEEEEKRAKARMEEDLELLMKTRMAEKLDDLMETAKARLQIKESVRPTKNAAHRDAESNYKGLEGYNIVEHEMPYSERPPRPGPGKSPCRSYDTAVYKPERDTVTPSEDERGQNPGHVPLAVPDPPSFEFDSEEEIPPDFAPKPRYPPFHRNLSHEPHNVHQTVVSPRLVQQIAYAVADILRGSDYDDVMSERSNYTERSRTYSSRANRHSPNTNRHFSDGDQYIENGSPSHDRHQPKREKHVARDLVAASPHRKGSERLPNFSRPRTENNPPESDLNASGLAKKSHPPNNNNILVERCPVQIAPSDVQGLSTDPIGDEGYRNRNGIGLRSSDLMARVNSSGPAGDSGPNGRISSFPIQDCKPKEGTDTKSGNMRLRRQSNFVLGRSADGINRAR